MRRSNNPSIIASTYSMTFSWFKYKILLVCLMGLPLLARGEELLFRDSTYTVRSITDKKIVLVSLTDVQKSLPISVIADTSSGLLVMVSSCNTVPVYSMEAKEFRRTDSLDYVSLNLVAQALCCTWKQEKKAIRLNPTSKTLSYHPVGFQIGDFAPGFQLLKSDSTVFASSDAIANGALIVIFFRSADWDPATISLLKTLESKMDSIKAAGATLVGIHGYDRKKSKKWEVDYKLTYPLVMDRSASVMHAFGVFDKGNLPFSSVYIVSRAGKIIYRDIMEDRQLAPDITKIMQALAQ
jgi:peroxiredoxin